MHKKSGVMQRRAARNTPACGVNGAVLGGRGARAAARAPLEKNSLCIRVMRCASGVRECA